MYLYIGEYSDIFCRVKMIQEITFKITIIYLQKKENIATIEACFNQKMYS